MDIGKRIKELRISRKLKQSELGEALSISGATVSSWECGRTEPKMGMIEEMAEFFGITKSELIEGKHPKKSQNIDFSRNSEFMDYVYKMWSLPPDNLRFVYNQIDFQIDWIEKEKKQKDGSSLA